MPILNPFFIMKLNVLKKIPLNNFINGLYFVSLPLIYVIKDLNHLNYTKLVQIVRKSATISSNTIVPLFGIFALSLLRSLLNFQSSAATAVLAKSVVDRYKCRYIVPAMYMPDYVYICNVYTIVYCIHYR